VHTVKTQLPTDSVTMAVIADGRDEIPVLQAIAAT
jgi:hypothetical protein